MSPASSKRPLSPAAESLHTPRLTLVHDDVRDDAPTERQLRAASELDCDSVERPTLPSPLPLPVSKPAPISRRFYTIEQAALRLGLSAAALRARCQRKAKQVGDRIVADLRGGVVAFKFGEQWRLTLPDFPKA